MTIDDFTLARVVHVCAMVGWVGALWFVWLSLLPAMKASRRPGDDFAFYEPLTRGLARQARIWLALLGLSGLWMVWRGGLWARYADAHFWWMHVMTAVWLFFALILFVLEPFGNARRAAAPAGPPDLAKQAAHHRAISIIALVTLIISLAGSHGLF